jgi:hypothetical protein
MGDPPEEAGRGRCREARTRSSATISQQGTKQSKAEKKAKQGENRTPEKSEARKKAKHGSRFGILGALGSCGAPERCPSSFAAGRLLVMPTLEVTPVVTQTASHWASTMGNVRTLAIKGAAGKRLTYRQAN